MRRALWSRLLLVAVLLFVWQVAARVARWCLSPVPRMVLPGTKDTTDTRILNFSPDGWTLAVASRKTETIRFWDVDSGQLRLAAPVPAVRAAILPKIGDDYEGDRFPPEHRKVCFSADSRMALLPTYGAVALWDIPSAKQVGSLDLRIRGPRLSPDGRFIIGRTERENEVKLWEIATGEELDTIPVWNKGHVGPDNYRFSPTGQTIVCQKDPARNVWLWSVTPPKQQALLDGFYSDLLFSPDGSLIALSAAEAPIRLYDAVTGEERRILQSDQSCVHSVAFSPDGRLLAADYSQGGKDEIRLWNVATGEVRAAIPFTNGSMIWRGGSLTFSADGKLLVWEGDAHHSFSGEAIVWDISAGSPAEVCRLPSDTPRVIAFSRGLAIVDENPLHGRTGLVADIRGWLAGLLGLQQSREVPSIAVADLASGHTVESIQDENLLGLGWREYDLAPDGRTLALQAKDGEVQLWDVPFRKPSGMAAAYGLLPVAVVLIIWWWVARRIRKSVTPVTKNGDAT